MCDFDDDGIGAEEMGIILGITDEIEEEANTKLSEEPLTPEEMLKTGNDIFDNNDKENFDNSDEANFTDFDDEY